MSTTAGLQAVFADPDFATADFATPDCLAALVAVCATAAVVGFDARSIVDNSSYRRRLIGTGLAVLCFAISDELAHALVQGIGAA